MFALYELMDLLPKSYSPNLRPKLASLFNFLKDSQPLTEIEAADQFLDGNRKHFNRLKNELKEALQKYIIINPSTWVDNEQKALYDTCYKAFATYKILLASNTKVAMEQARMLFPKLYELEAHQLIHMMALDFYFYYTSMKVSPRLAKKYRLIAEEQVRLIEVETLVRTTYGKVGMLCNNRSSFSKKIVRQLDEMLDECKPFLHIGSNTIDRLIYDIIITRYIVAYDHQNVLEYCDKALIHFRKAKPKFHSFRFDYLMKKIPALISTQQLDVAKKIAKEAGKLRPVGKFNWHVALIYRVIICLHQAKYQEAYDIFKTQAKRSCSYQILIEYWKIIEGFIYFLVQRGYIKEYEKTYFSLGKFLNEVPLYSRDKSGHNINILIIQIIIRLHREEYNKIIDRVDALRAYVRSYTRNPETLRANIFINMILKMEAAQFHKVGVERRTRRLLKRLMSIDLSMGQNLSVEIIPFPVLWEELLKMLETKFQSTNRIAVSHLAKK